MQVLNSLLAQFVKEWLEPAEKCLLQLKALLMDITHILCDQQLSSYPALQSHFKQTVRGHINAIEKEARSQIEKVFQREKSPYTANASFVHTVNQIRLERFMLQYDQNSGIWQAAAGEGKAAMAEWYKRTHFIGSESNADEEAHEMCMYLKAYWDIAMNRAVDEICMVLESVSAHHNIIPSVTHVGIADACVTDDAQVVLRRFATGVEYQSRSRHAQFLLCRRFNQ